MSRRTIITTIIIPCMLISGLIIFLINNQQELQGELILSQTRLDFGTIPEWKGKITKTVLGQNTGNKPINISRIQTGSSYAEVDGPTTILPESEGTFKVTLHPQFLPTDTTSTTAILFTDSIKTPQVYLTIVATAKRFATLSAEVCDFGEIHTETSYEKHVKLFVNEPLNKQEIKLLPTSHNMLKWKIAPDENTDCYILTIRLHATNDDKKNGKLFSDLLTIAFPNDRTLTLPIVAKYIEHIIAIPESLTYGEVNTGTIPSLRFTINAKSTFKVLSIQSPDYLRVVETANPNGTKEDTSVFGKQFEVTWDVSKSPILMREVINISTTISSIRIPIYGYISKD